MQNQEKTPGRSFPISGIFLILLGLFLLLKQFVEINIPGGAVLASLGLFFILWGALEHIAGLLIPGGILIGLSVGVFLSETEGLIEPYMEGGAVLISLGAGFALISLLSRLFTVSKNNWALIVAAVLLLFGLGAIVAESPTDSPFKTIVAAVMNSLNYLWPLLLIGLGAKIVLSRRGRSV